MIWGRNNPIYARNSAGLDKSYTRSSLPGGCNEQDLLPRIVHRHRSPPPLSLLSQMHPCCCDVETYCVFVLLCYATTAGCSCSRVHLENNCGTPTHPEFLNFSSHVTPSQTGRLKNQTKHNTSNNKPAAASSSHSSSVCRVVASTRAHSTALCFQQYQLQSERSNRQPWQGERRTTARYWRALDCD